MKEGNREIIFEVLVKTRTGKNMMFAVETTCQAETLEELKACWPYLEARYNQKSKKKQPKKK